MHLYIFIMYKKFLSHSEISVNFGKSKKAQNSFPGKLMLSVRDKTVLLHISEWF